ARLDPSGRAAAVRPSGGDPQVRPCTPDREAPAGQSPDRPIPSRRARDDPPRAGSPAMAGAGIRVPAAPHRLPGDSPAELPLSRADVMNDFTLFLGKFLTQGTAIASLAPSSRWLSRTTVRNIDWAHAAALVELGAGTGPITRVMAAKARPDCRVVVL